MTGKSLFYLMFLIISTKGTDLTSRSILASFQKRGPVYCLVILHDDFSKSNTHFMPVYSMNLQSKQISYPSRICGHHIINIRNPKSLEKLDANSLFRKFFKALLEGIFWV